MFKRVLGRIDAVQLRVRPLAFVVGVVKKYGEERGGRLGAVIAYYAFFSIFPAILAMVAITGFLLEGNPEWRDDIVDSAIGSIPVVGENIAESGLNGSGWALVIGLGTALWAGSGAMLATEYAFSMVWDIPVSERAKGPIARARGIAMLALFGLGIAGATVLTNVVTQLSLPGLADWGIAVGNLVVNVGIALLAFRILTTEKLSWATHWPGAVIAGLGFYVLQNLGSLLVDRYVATASDTYGTFAVVIGLLTWFHLLAQITLIGAVVNVVRERQLWPRALLKPG